MKIAEKPEARYFAMCGKKEIVVKSDGEDLAADDLVRLEQSCGCKERADEAESGIVAVALARVEGLPEGYRTEPLRFYCADHADDDVLLASRAKALLEWQGMTRFCGCCGHALEPHPKLTARVCPSCGNVIFPRINPCVIVLVHREGKILLARNVNARDGLYACLAGFIEAGETAEHAVMREVMEETGLRIRNLRYFGSQSWPFPAQLMFAYTAEYESGELSLQADEIADAGWYDPLNLPPVTPSRGSIAYRLIQAAVQEAKAKKL